MAGMMALLRTPHRSRAGADLVRVLGGPVQNQLIGAIPPPLRPRKVDPVPRNGPRVRLLHDPLRENEISPEAFERWAAGGQARMGRGSRSASAGRGGRSRIWY